MSCAKTFFSGAGTEHIVIKRWPRRPSQGTPHYTNDLAGSLGLSCVRGASLEETLGETDRSQSKIAANTSSELKAAKNGVELHMPVSQIFFHC
jgi:hypothetical protein